MALITERYASEIAGVLTCYDRMIIQGYIAPWSHADGMTNLLLKRIHLNLPVLSDVLIFRHVDREIRDDIPV